MATEDWSKVTALATIALVVVTGGLAGAAFYAARQVKEVRAARQSQIAVDLLRLWDSDSLVEARAKLPKEGAQLAALMKALHESEPLGYQQLLREPNLLEDLAILVERKIVDRDYIKESLGNTITYRWKLWEPAIQYLRSPEAAPDDVAQPTLYEHFESLAAEMAA
jgi:hypothetical protein